MLLHLPRVLNADELQRVRAGLAEGPWIDGRATAGAHAARVKHNQQLDEASLAARRLREQVLAALARHAPFRAAALPRRISPPLFNRYAPGADRYGDHVDNTVRAAADGTPLRGDLSATLFLAPPEDYDGGDLVVEEVTGARRVRLPAGDLLLYPGHHVHRVEPVTRGARLAAVFWVESLVPRHEERLLLFEMDRHLSTLRAQQPDAPVVLGLTASYHHLLRLWAQT